MIVFVMNDGSFGVVEVTVVGTIGLVDVIDVVMFVVEMVMLMVMMYRLIMDVMVLEIEILVDIEKIVVMGDVMLISGCQVFNIINDMLVSEGSDVFYVLVSQDFLLIEVIGGITLVLGFVVLLLVLW